MWEVLPSQNVPNTTTLLSNVLCTKLSCFHLHNWLRHRGGISYFYLENKTFYFGDFSKFLSEVTWSKILFDQTLNWLLGTRIESTKVSSNGGITNEKKKIQQKNHIFINLSSIIGKCETMNVEPKLLIKLNCSFTR